MLQLQAIQLELEYFMKDEYLKSLPERAALMMKELGDICACWTHDPKHNPKTRALGVDAVLKAERLSAFGDAFVMLVTMAIVEEVDITEAVSVGLQRIRAREYMSNEHREREQD